MIVIVIPTYNEKDNLPALLAQIAVLRLPDWRAIIVDDNSPDNTGQIAENLRSQYPLEVIHRAKKMGLGSAYREGFARALALGADQVLQMDADLSHDPAVIPELLKNLRQADWTIGARYIKGGGSRNWSWPRKALSRLANAIVRRLLGSRLHDLTSGYKAFQAATLKRLDWNAISSLGYNFQIEVNIALERAGCTAVEVPIIFIERQSGKSKFDLAIIWESIRRVFYLAWSGETAVKFLLVGLLLLAAVIRFYDLPRGDPISDEVLYGFRSIGYLDFDFAVSQPTTLQLVAQNSDVLPWWTKLSFHDHPALVFLVQHVFIKFLGVNGWGLRSSSALFSLLSVYLLYLIGRRCFGRRAGLIAAAVLASNVLMLYVARTGVQESQLIFFILLTVYCFFRAQNDQRMYLAWGFSFGLVLLTKYTAGFLLLPMLFYWLLFSRALFKSRWWYGGIGLLALTISPFVVYNLILLKTLGHFDFQLTYIFGQQVPYWQVAPGKEIGGLVQRLRDLPLNLWNYNSRLFDLVGILALAYGLKQVLRRSKTFMTEVFLLLTLAVNLILYLAIGPSPRFLTMMVPWVALLIGQTVAVMAQSRRRLATFGVTGCLVLFIAWETFFSINSYLVYRPIGQSPWLSSSIHWDMHPWGYNVLDDRLQELLAGKYPSVSTGYTLPWLNKIKRQAIDSGRKSGRQPLAAMFIYNDNMSNLASLWVMSRRALYDGWSIIPAQSYGQTLAANGQDFYRQQGFTDFYFIQNTDRVLLNEPDRLTTDGDELEAKLKAQGLVPVEIINHDQQTAFQLYHW